MTQCIPGEWAATWQSWPSACQVSGLHPDNHDPVLFGWVLCTLTIMAQCLPGEWVHPDSQDPVLSGWVGCTLTMRTPCFWGEWAAPWRWGPSAFGVSRLHPDSEDPVLLGWVGSTLTVRTQCLQGEWAAPWQSWPSAFWVSGLHPDDHDPVLARWVALWVSGLHPYTFTIMTQCLPGEWSVSNTFPVVTACQIICCPWHLDSRNPVLARWVCCIPTSSWT